MTPLLSTSSSDELVDSSDVEFDKVSALLSNGVATRVRFRSATRAKNGRRRCPCKRDDDDDVSTRLVDGVSVVDISAFVDDVPP